MPLFVLALALALLDWIAVARSNTRLGYITRPGVMLAMLAGLWVSADLTSLSAHPEALPLLWFAWGLVFSLAGDVLLMLPRQQFIGGLVAFLLAHLAYILGFGGLGYSHGLILPWVIITLLVVVVGSRVYLKIATGLRDSGEQKLQVPVAGYSLVISAMLVAALSSLINAHWEFGHAYLVSAGALLFYISDIILGWDRFVEPLPHAKLKVAVMYHLGQFGLVLGAALHYLQYT
ncbi:MAG: lysoplasmalogenase [Chloroflexi bacterium]|nr:lysoplasmalogenase [Chloroflexota bacterium]